MLNNIAATLGGGVPVSLTDYESIQTYTLGSSQANITFSSIPTTYTHLQLRLIARSARTTTVDSVVMQVGNGSVDTGANYSTHILWGDGATAQVDAIANTTNSYGFGIAGNTATAGTFGVAIIDLLDYANTSKYKTVRLLGGYDRNGAGEVDFISAGWRSTSAINTIKLYSGTASNLVQYTQIALYGIK